MINRAQFVEYFEQIKPGLGAYHSPLWIPEQSRDSSQTVHCEWFVCVPPVEVHSFKEDYWSWCNENLAGAVRCFSSDSDNLREWWGFTDQADMVLWTLRWS